MKIDKEEKMRWKNNNDILFDIISLNYEGYHLVFV